jgi:uncharacterized protein YggE
MRLVLGAGAAFVVLAFAGAGSAATSASGGRTITVTGSGSVTVVPNRALFSFGVTTQGRTAAGALAENAGEMRKVIAALKDAGIAAADIQTASVSLSPRYSQDGETILGYTASNTVSATSKDINKAGSTVDAAVAAGANQVSGPSLTRADSSRARLGAVRSVVEGSSAPTPIPLAKTAGPVEATPIQPGTQEVDATVTVEFAIS